jgi:hypothetical protein
VALAQLPQLCGGSQYFQHLAARYLESCTAKQRVCQRGRIAQSPRQGHSLAMPVSGAGRVPERPLCGCAKSERAYRRIVPEINVAMSRVAFFVVDGKAGVAMLKGLCRSTAVPLHGPGAVMSLKHDPRVI